MLHYSVKQDVIVSSFVDVKSTPILLLLLSLLCLGGEVKYLMNTLLQHLPAL